MPTRSLDENVPLHLLLEVEAEAQRWRRRALFLLSVIFHMVLIGILVESPGILKRGRELLGLTAEVQQPKPETLFLYLPPDLEKRLERPPKTNHLSDQNRVARGQSPVINPDALRMPYLRGNTPLPEIAGAQPKPPSMPTPPAPKPVPASPPAANPTPPASNPADHKLQLYDVARAQPQENPRLELPSPGQAIQQSLQAAAEGRASGRIPGAGDSTAQLNNLSSSFSTEGPIILSDTRGVDFGPYLARIIYIVRQNWYAVIPESARLGEKGRVALDFTIMKNGSVPDLVTSASSGSYALDEAARAGIRASLPFPPLPAEFTGDHLRLRFIFLYNLGFGP
jgi:TonB family protein